MIWSPLSNLLLYGDTAKMKAAKENGIQIGIGSDWSPSGSKNLFGELKVARLFSEAQGGIFSDRALLAMATRNASQILGWQDVLGSIATGKRADLLVISGKKGDPYSTFLEAPETKIVFVVINGVPRFGEASLMSNFAFAKETLRIGSSTKVLNLAQETADPVVSKVSLAEAGDRLKDGLRRLPELAKELEKPRRQPREIDPRIAPQWFLVLDHQEPAGIALRPHLPGPDGRATARGPLVERALAKPLSTLLEPLDLDVLTVANDESFFDRLRAQPNLPDYVKKELPSLYGD
jgi:Amidohydrolase family